MNPAKNNEPIINPVTWKSIPLWRGFNLLEKFTSRRGNMPFRKDIFELIKELGFNFVRLPMDYRLWTEPSDLLSFKENVFEEIDQAVAWGRELGIHVCINFHRAPGYCINPPDEPWDLWTDPEAQRICAAHWAYFAVRYKGIPGRELSFNLFNEPHRTTEELYFHVAEMMVKAIRGMDPDRLIIADGLDAGNKPVPSLIPLHVVHGTRGYSPVEISHYQAPWMKFLEGIPEPTWPMADGFDNARLVEKSIVPWKAIEAQGPAVYVGEWGAFNHTPHGVTLAWMEDCLKNWKKAGWGWCLWNFEGDFGPLNSGRKDVDYEDYKGFKLDRKMLELLKRY